MVALHPSARTHGRVTGLKATCLWQAGTNVLAIFTIPFLLKLYLATNTDIRISPVPMLIKLMVTILLPLAVGKALRQIEPLAAFRLRNKKWFGIASSTFLVLVPLMKVSSASEQISEMPLGNIFLVILVACVLHVVYLAMNTAGTVPLSLGVAERKAVIILTSQKTLPVAVTVISFLPETAASAAGDGEGWQLGIIVIPCIVCHLMQLLIDALFVNKWATMTAEGGPLGLGTVPADAGAKTSAP